MSSELMIAREAYRAGDYEAALSIAQRLLREQALAVQRGEMPASGLGEPVEVWLLLAAIWQAMGFDAESEVAYRQAVRLLPDRTDIRLNLAHVLRRSGQIDEAEKTYLAVLETSPANIPAGLALIEFYCGCKRFGQAVAAGESMLARGLEHTDIRQVIGNAHFAAGDFAQALAVYQSALVFAPQHAALLYGAALAALQVGKADVAGAFLERILAHQPDHLQALLKWAAWKQQAGDREAVISAYYRAARLAPMLGDIHLELGRLLLSAGRTAAAVEALEAAIEAGAGGSPVMLSLAQAYQVQGDCRNALRVCEQGLQKDAGCLALQVEAALLRLLLGDWETLGDRCQTLLPALLDESASDVLRPLPSQVARLPLALLPAEWLTVARAYLRQAGMALPDSAGLWQAASEVLQADGGVRARRLLRVGYWVDLDADEGVRRLELLLREHDRQQYQLQVYVMGGAGEKTLPLAAGETCHDLRGLGDAQVVAAVQAGRLDILVDLQGYSPAFRLGVRGQRLAPVQLLWPGYPGSLGPELCDYRIADPWRLPVDEQAFYHEAPVWLPEVAELADGAQPISSVVPIRPFCGLPAQGFVLAVLAPPGSVTPTAFACWMRLLKQLPGSVLWLLSGPEGVADGLRGQAVRAGVEPQRLVFAQALPRDQHLARLHHADLVLAPDGYGGEPAILDALWAGVPVLALAGTDAPHRAAASLLAAAGCPDMVVPDWATYEMRALDLARERVELHALRLRLQEHKQQPLFDTRRTVRGLEQAYLAVWQRSEAGLPPAPVAVHLPAPDTHHDVQERQS